MDLLEAIKNRHSVRKYQDKEIPQSIVNILEEDINKCNKEGNLTIKLITNEPNAFKQALFSYGKFTNVCNYFILSGIKSPNLHFNCGYYGQRLVLLAQTLGLNTCWVALNYQKSVIKNLLNKDEKLVCVIALGYGETNGSVRKSKRICDISLITQETPEWYKKGLEAALLAPTAINQQKFYFELIDKQVRLKKTGGFYANIDLGIVSYHFEIAAGKENFTWIK